MLFSYAPAISPFQFGLWIKSAAFGGVWRLSVGEFVRRSYCLQIARRREGSELNLGSGAESSIRGLLLARSDSGRCAGLDVADILLSLFEKTDIKQLQ